MVLYDNFEHFLILFSPNLFHNFISDFLRVRHALHDLEVSDLFLQVVLVG